VQAANALLPAVVAGKSYSSHITLLDMYDAITDPTIGGGYDDAVHPSSSGYVDMAGRLWTGLETALAECR
jgi:lysophospholipase L1-like esterase